MQTAVTKGGHTEIGCRKNLHNALAAAKWLSALQYYSETIATTPIECKIV